MHAERGWRFRTRTIGFWLFTLVYLFLGAAVAYLLGKQIVAAHRAAAPGGPARAD